jgi:hypothetical protein
MSEGRVERVARAIFKALWPNSDWDREGHLHRAYLDASRAAIAAMRVPTKAMVRVGNDWDCAPFVAGRVWQEMIDAALGEGDG